MRTHAYRLVATLAVASLAIGAPAAHAHASGHASHHAHRHANAAATRELLATHESVSFDSDSFTLSPDAMRSLDRFAHQLRPAGHAVRIEAIGYADATGTDPHNLLLAERRATAVLHYLHTRGVSLLRMSAVSYGPGMPQMSNQTPEGRAANRRVVIVVVPFKDNPRET
ncbi:MAG TPA: OmpA family protein [Caulobacteraceae bacterium]|nr:OmpA family protein [Caulobacteraceae bacterium]